MNFVLFLFSLCEFCEFLQICYQSSRLHVDCMVITSSLVLNYLTVLEQFLKSVCFAHKTY